MGLYTPKFVKIHTFINIRTCFFNFDLSYALLYWMFVYCRSVYLKIYTFPERFIVYKFRQLSKQVQLKKQVNYNTSGKLILWLIYFRTGKSYKFTLRDL